jgi:hypothetical protein
VYGVTPLGEPAPEKQGAGERHESNILFLDGTERDSSKYLADIKQLYSAFMMNAEKGVTNTHTPYAMHCIQRPPPPLTLRFRPPVYSTPTRSGAVDWL